MATPIGTITSVIPVKDEDSLEWLYEIDGDFYACYTEDELDGYINDWK